MVYYWFVITVENQRWQKICVFGTLSRDGTLVLRVEA